jgi:hypothetical protein
MQHRAKKNLFMGRGLRIESVGCAERLHTIRKRKGGNGAP